MSMTLILKGEPACTFNSILRPSSGMPKPLRLHSGRNACEKRRPSTFELMTPVPSTDRLSLGARRSDRT